ncbi:type IV pilin protein [Vogesella sp. LIG4]|uniref:type IV pilin protein n=1 Tax=Vogesella sp. LIG4 TaxID=1192162 RepID=UPI00081F847F|nr:type IV pilin protein [Vogesella sp. LIG4]SCK31060.1 type IV pilus assembly protein PilE [Vogesella sp. LIG4]
MIDRKHICHFRRGFTLIELMVVVAILGIIAAFAYPSYVSYVIKTNRSAAESFMTEVAAKQEEYVLDARSYAGSTASLGVTVPTDVAKVYSITVTAFNASSPPAYSVVATPATTGMQATDGTLTLMSNGQKLPSNKWN